ncbi:UDP-N-acetylglucosamine 1-carboxyvinyltransferase [Polycladomyces subterraneus]|uniref:UDP-N-acetylglucosamine 1-carboxyvinyltransferase n=1 Tax=Polycladomyces subterraneus TaxID=1016997 RepID=A0ABT8IJ41_9BACL|nr:UDP-N-acetylglucosamine 1-carboxyvinyltransferase [Polycladomyces subterraneus]MDN4592805.1 UDP-N-acetylglucosamine 1-carboxyvinyltransferase [Polycladomyces subterraneus]
MKTLKIKGGRPLIGRVQIGGAKNSAVAVIPATVLAESGCEIENLPEIRDVDVYAEILRDLGAVVTKEGSCLSVDPSRLSPVPLPDKKVKKLRASYYLIGALLGRFGEVSIGLPGGCDLGPRPIDQHIKGFKALGATVRQSGGILHVHAPKLTGARIFLDIVSVGATINIMLAAVRARGLTVIENAAKEPEIVDVATFLNTMGAQIKGAGTDVIRIRGVSHLRGCRHAIIPDRIEAGTYLIAAAATRGEVSVEQVIPKHLEPLTAKLREMGVRVREDDETVWVQGGGRYRAVDVKTAPYPGFPTDLQQPLTALLTQAEGVSVVTENIYSARFKQVPELARMGARIRVAGTTAIVEGPTPLFGTSVTATDLRAGASLVIAGLSAQGETEIAGVGYIDRGYERLEEKLKSLGAEIWRS